MADSENSDSAKVTLSHQVLGGTSRHFVPTNGPHPLAVAPRCSGSSAFLKIDDIEGSFGCPMCVFLSFVIMFLHGLIPYSAGSADGFNIQYQCILSTPHSTSAALPYITSSSSGHIASLRGSSQQGEGSSVAGSLEIMGRVGGEGMLFCLSRSPRPLADRPKTFIKGLVDKLIDTCRRSRQNWQHVRGTNLTRHQILLNHYPQLHIGIHLLSRSGVYPPSPPSPGCKMSFWLGNREGSWTNQCGSPVVATLSFAYPLH